jgi:hypothetical protein
LHHPAEVLVDRCDGYWSRTIQEMKCSGKTKQTMIMSRMVLLISGRNRAAVRVMQAKLGQGKIIKARSLSQLGTNDRQQQRLHHQRIDSCRANQPSPETPQSQANVILPASHAHEYRWSGPSGNPDSPCMDCWGRFSANFCLSGHFACSTISLPRITRSERQYHHLDKNMVSMRSASRTVGKHQT